MLNVLSIYITIPGDSKCHLKVSVCPSGNILICKGCDHLQTVGMLSEVGQIGNLHLARMDGAYDTPEISFH